MPVCFTVDHRNLLFRSWYALKDKGLSTIDGRPSGGVFGYVNSILGLVSSMQIMYMLVADDSETNWRKELFPHYKEHSHELPDEFFVEAKAVEEFLQLLGVERVQVDGYEADDIMASIACELSGRGWGVALVTNDKDLAQCVCDAKNVAILRAAQTGYEWMQELDVYKKFGVHATQIPDYLALVGDPSDGIPGIRGIGEKTASALLLAHESLEGILDHVADLPDRFRVKLQQLEKHVRVYKELATCKTNAWEYVQPMIRSTPDFNGLDRFAREWELVRLQEWVKERSRV